MSTVPERYREVSVTDVDVPLESGPLRDLLTSRPVYRRSEYMVVRRAGQAALVRLHRGPETGLFARLEDVELLAGPAETVYLHRPDLDTGVPTALLAAAAEAPGARCVVVEGSYGHVSFVLDPAPVRLHVLDVVPPRPAKLLDQLQRVLETADDLPGVELVPHVVELADLLPDQPDGHLPAALSRWRHGRARHRRRLPRRGARRARTGHCWAAPAPGRSTTSSTTARCARSTCVPAPSPLGPACPPARCW